MAKVTESSLLENGGHAAAADGAANDGDDDNDNDNEDNTSRPTRSSIAAETATATKKGCHIRWSRITKVVDVKESSGGLLRGSIAGKKRPPPPSSSPSGKESGDVDGNDSKADGGKDVGQAAESTTKVILNEVSGEAKAGQVMALMGPSGSGKTSLLDALSGRSAYDSGTLTIDAQPANSSNLKRLKRKIAYIKQSDVFFDHLTVRDQLTYTALLRLPSRGRRMNNPSDGQASNTVHAGLTRDEKNAEVNRILTMLRLTKCADTPIRLVSGGERKRVNIGTELLTDPGVIMLDEPTSGLDSTSAVALLSMLQELARTQHKTIITSIHQPSSSVFQRFDMVLLLADGCVVFFGSPVDSLSYLSDRGYACPPGYNAADHWMDLLVVDSALEGGTAISTSVTDTTCSAPVGPNGTTLCEDSTSSLEEFIENEAGKGHAGNSGAGSDVDKPAVVGATVFKNSDVAIPAGAADEDEDAVSSKMTDVFNRKKATMRRRSSAIRLGRRQRIAAIAGSTPKARLIAAWNNDEFSDELDIAVEEEEAIMKEQGGVHQQDAATDADAERKFNTSWFTQFCVLTHRCMKNSRSAIFTPLNIVKSVCLGVMVGLLWFQMPYTERTVVDRSSYFFFTMTYWVFESMFAALFSFPNERQVIFKERASGSYHLSAYFFA